MFKSYFRGAERDALKNYFRLPSSAQTAVLFAPISASGGVETTITVDGKDYRVHTFLSSGTFEVTDLGTTDGSVDYLIVAGGGSGSPYLGAGGGAGGLLSNLVSGDSPHKVSVESFAITVGAGGSRATGEATGNNGANSSAFTLVATGGGAGGRRDDTRGKNGGSGGGGGDTWPDDGPSIPGTGIVGQGFDGGAGHKDGTDSNMHLSGGGGGAGGPGFDGFITTDSSDACDGGPGLLVNIDGNGYYWAGGGGGSSFKFQDAGDGGIGGGGGGGHDGSSSTEFTPGVGGTGGMSPGIDGKFGRDTSDGGDAGANTGSGGGGGAWNFVASGAGGSGIVIVRYPLTF